jgi:hypothetical protein
MDWQSVVRGGRSNFLVTIPAKENAMTRYRTGAGLALLGCLILTCLVLGGQDKKEDPAAQDKEVISTKMTQQPSAASVNFRKELNLPFATLGTLGSRISAARRAADPVALAHAANELNVAEQVSGKKASLTSAAVLKEAAELASLRRQAAELQAVQRVAQQVATEQETVNLLKNEIALAQQSTKAYQDALAQNQEPTSAPRQIIVNNYTTQYLTIYISGYYMGELLPGASQVYSVEARYNPVTVKALGNDDAEQWGPSYIWGRFKKYTWNIN